MAKQAFRGIRISRVCLEGIRGFDGLDLSLLDPAHHPRQLMLAIGVNGTGKTTLLRSIALGLAARHDAEALLAAPIGHMVAHGRENGRIVIGLQDASGGEREVETILARSGEGDSVVSQTATGSIGQPRLVCGYGSGRAVEGRAAGKGYRIADSVESLFRYNTAFNNVELSLRRLRDYQGQQRYDAWLARLERALGLGDDDRIELPPGGGVVISGPTVGGEIAIEALADGYRLSLMWMLDLFAWAMRSGGLGKSWLEAVLLIDEIDQHLHPSMQARLLTGLREALPDVQIITTSHSPLVALGLGDGLLVPLHRERGRSAVTVAGGVPGLERFSVEDVYVHPALFGTSPYAPLVEEKLAEYRALVATPAAQREGPQSERLRALARELRALQLDGDLP